MLQKSAIMPVDTSGSHRREDFLQKTEDLQERPTLQIEAKRNVKAKPSLDLRNGVKRGLLKIPFKWDTK